jgi:hypothetical protein
MNIEKGYQEDKVNAESVVDIAMDFLFEKFIAEKEKNLSEADALMLAEVGLTLKIVAQKARAFELLQKGQNSVDYRN